MTEAVARGSLVLTLDANQLNKGLDKAKAKAKKDGSELAKNFKDSSKEIIGSKFGGESVLGMGAKAGVAGAAIAGGAFAAKELYEMLGPSKDLNKEFERGADLAKKWQESVANGINRSKEALAEFASVAATPEGIAAVNAQLKSMQKEELGSEENLRRLKAEAEKWNSKFGGKEQAQSWAVGEFENRQKQAREELKTAQESYDAQRKHLTELTKKKNELMNPSQSAEARTALRGFLKELDDAVDYMNESADEGKLRGLKEKFGLNPEQEAIAKLKIQKKNAQEARQAMMDFEKELTSAYTNIGKSADEIKLADLKAKFGLSEDETAIARWQMKMKNATEAAKEGVDLMKDLMMENGLMIKKSTEEARLDELIKKGIDERQAEGIRRLINLKKKLNVQYTPLKALEKGTAEEISYQNKSAFDDRKKESLKVEQELMKQTLLELKKLNINVLGLELNSPEI